MTWVNLRLTLQEALDTKKVPWDISNVVRKTEDYWIFTDSFPVSAGHLLFVPVDSSIEKISAAFNGAIRNSLVSTACNIGINLGTEAGQTVMYPHVHFIPRTAGDVQNPAGGIRNVIPGKGDYTAEPVVETRQDYATQIIPTEITKGD